MTEQEARQILGVSVESSWENVLQVSLDDFYTPLCDERKNKGKLFALVSVLLKKKKEKTNKVLKKVDLDAPRKYVIYFPCSPVFFSSIVNQLFYCTCEFLISFIYHNTCILYKILFSFFDGQKYNTLFENNAKVGSFYLQSKVHRAKESLEMLYSRKDSETAG